jgi:pyridoxamine 5'-phosphate oxidase family protein
MGSTDSSASFTDHEVAYLRSQPLTRLATVSPEGQPDVAPVGFEFDGTYIYVGGINPSNTRKFRNVRAGNEKVALAIDDLVSADPWTPRFVRTYGTAELVERDGQFGVGPYLPSPRPFRGASTSTDARSATTTPNAPLPAAPSTRRRPQRRRTSLRRPGAVTCCDCPPPPSPVVARKALRTPPIQGDVRTSTWAAQERAGYSSTSRSIGCPVTSAMSS